MSAGKATKLLISDMILTCINKRMVSIVSITLLGTLATFFYAYFATPIFRATAVIAPAGQSQQQSASAALASLGGIGQQIAGNMGILIGTTNLDKLEAILESHKLVSRVINKYSLIDSLFQPTHPVFFWKRRTTERNIWDAELALREIVKLRKDSRTGLITLFADHSDRQLCIKILNGYLNELAKIIQESELEKIESKRSFVETQLQTATDPVIIAKLQALLSDQVEQSMMAQNVENFAYETIDPPASSDNHIRPKRKMLCISGAFMSLGLALSINIIHYRRQADRELHLREC